MKSEHTELEWLNRWYLKQCDGVWEHAFGITLETLDNPGWRLKVDLQGTDLKKKDFKTISKNLDEIETQHDWWVCKVENSVFDASSSGSHLFTILSAFRRWATDRE